MDSKSMTRKDFFVLTFSLVGSAVIASNCGSSGGGGGGTGGKGSGGSGSGGSGAGGSGAGGRDGGVDTGAAGSDGGGNDVPVSTDSGNDVAVGDTGGGDAATNCTLPLPEEQLTVAVTDNATHVHTLTVGAAVLNATTAQSVDTAAVNGHMHTVMFAPADLAVLRGGGTVMILSGTGGGNNHTHTYRVSCHPLPDAGVDATVG